VPKNNVVSLAIMQAIKWNEGLEIPCMGSQD